MKAPKLPLALLDYIAFVRSTQQSAANASRTTHTYQTKMTPPDVQPEDIDLKEHPPATVKEIRPGVRMAVQPCVFIDRTEGPRRKRDQMTIVNFTFFSTTVPISGAERVTLDQMLAEATRIVAEGLVQQDMPFAVLSLPAPVWIQNFVLSGPRYRT